jgi:hypothetical protein
MCKFAYHIRRLYLNNDKFQSLFYFIFFRVLESNLLRYKICMRLLILFVLPTFLWAQQRDFHLNWDKYAQVQVLDDVLNIPQPKGYSIFFDETTNAFSTAITIEIDDSTNNQFVIENIQSVKIPHEQIGDLLANELPSSPDFSIHNTKNRFSHQVYIRLEPFFVVNGFIHAVKNFSLVSQYASSSHHHAVQSDFSLPNTLPQSGYRFEVAHTGIHKITGKFLRDLGVPIGTVNPQKLKIFGLGGTMLPLKNGAAANVNVGMSENPLQLVGMDDGHFDDNDYILFYAKGLGEWNEESNTAINLFQDRANYILSHDGEAGLRVNTLASLPSTSTHQTRGESTVHFEEDKTNIAQMGRVWLGDSFLNNTSRVYPINLEGYASGTSVELTVSGAGVSTNSSQLTVSIDDVNFDIFLNSTQTLVKAFLNRETENFIPRNSDMQVEVLYNSFGLTSAIGYLDYIRVNYQRSLDGNLGQFGFTPLTTETHRASNADAIWELYDDGSISVYQSNGADIYFTPSENVTRLHLYNENDAHAPMRSDLGDSFTSPNLREQLINGAEYIIIAQEEFVEEANRLAMHHRTHTGLQTQVLLLSDIYDDFNAGNIDIAAIRNAIRYAYFNNTDENKPKYICLFGDTSYDYKDRVLGNNNIVPTFQALQSFHLANSYMSDDFYAMMDDDEGNLGYADRMDIAVGRILFDTKDGALAVVNKAIDYSLSYGDWQNTLTILSDDPDQSWENVIQEKLDDLGEEIILHKPFINLQKIHSDSYEQVVSASGNRYPGVNEALENQFIQGTLAINYFGHGGETGLSSESIFDREFADRLYHPGKYPLFVTSTCEFSRFDNPEEYTVGEASYANPAGGVIGLISTTRQIYVTNGINYNKIIAKYLYALDSDEYPTISEALRLAKNEFSGTSQRRIVFYIGDPALKLAIPSTKVDLTHFNGSLIAELSDEQKQMSALDRVNLAGQVSDADGNLRSDFDGEIVFTIFDKGIQKTTLGNDGNGTFTYNALGNVVFKGNAEVVDGFWDLELVIPKDISLPNGQARISLYAVNNERINKLTGLSNDLFIGGINDNPANDNLGPTIELFLDNENFESGDLTGSNPKLIANFHDENGINTSGGLGHELLAVLDGVTQKPIILNNFYLTNLSDFRSGSLDYVFSNLSPGNHTLSVTAWDTYNNFSTQTIDFVVSDKNNIIINSIYNVPNPFQTKTTFWIDHNKPRELLEANVVIHDISGKKVWDHTQTLYSGDSGSSEITWDGKSYNGVVLNKGVYLCTISLKSTLSNTNFTESHRIILH